MYRQCILAVSSLSNSTARHARLDALDMSNVLCRVRTRRRVLVSKRDVTSQVEFGLSLHLVSNGRTPVGTRNTLFPVIVKGEANLCVGVNVSSLLYSALGNRNNVKLTFIFSWAIHLFTDLPPHHHHKQTADPQTKRCFDEFLWLQDSGDVDDIVLNDGVNVTVLKLNYGMQ